MRARAPGSVGAGLAGWVMVLAASSAEAQEFQSAFPVADPSPTVSFEGRFHRPPAEHWRIELPGQTATTAARSERSRPVFTDRLLLVGSATGTGLYALDRSTGNQVRHYPGVASVDAEPVVAGEILFFADSGGSVWSYTLAGEQRWTYDTAAPVLTGPTLHEGVIYIVTVDDLVLALDADTGAMRWRHQHRGDLGRKVDLALYASPHAVVAGTELLVGFSDGTLTALDLAGGDPAWQARVGEGRYPDLVADPLAWGGLVFASGFEEPLVALDPASRQITWTLPYGSAARPTLVDLGDTQLLVHPSTDGNLRAVDPRTGEERWTWSSGTDGALTEAVATEAGLWVASSVGTVSLVEPSSGRTRWTYAPPFLMEGLSAPVSVSGRQLAFVSNAGHLYSFVIPRPDPEDPPLSAIEPLHERSKPLRRAR